MNKRRRYTAKARRLERHKINERDRKAKPAIDLFFDSDAIAAIDPAVEDYIWDRSQEINEKLDKDE